MRIYANSKENGKIERETLPGKDKTICSQTRTTVLWLEFQRGGTIRSRTTLMRSWNPKQVTSHLSQMAFQFDVNLSGSRNPCRDTWHDRRNSPSTREVKTQKSRRVYSIFHRILPRANSIWPGIAVLDSWKYVWVPLGFLSMKLFNY